MLKKIAGFGFAATMSVSAFAAPTTLTFDGAPGGGGFVGPQVESGFTYGALSGSLYVNQPTSTGNNDLEGEALVGGGVAYFNKGGSLFTYTGLDYGVYVSSGSSTQTLSVAGLLGGNVLATDFYTIAGDSSTPFATFVAMALNGLNIDELRVTLNAANDPVQNYQAIDNVSFDDAVVTGSVPEAATWAMFIAGFGAVGVGMRRRKIAVRFA